MFHIYIICYEKIETLNIQCNLNTLKLMSEETKESNSKPLSKTRKPEEIRQELLKKYQKEMVDNGWYPDMKSAFKPANRWTYITNLKCNVCYSKSVTTDDKIWKSMRLKCGLVLYCDDCLLKSIAGRLSQDTVIKEIDYYHTNINCFCGDRQCEIKISDFISKEDYNKFNRKTISHELVKLMDCSVPECGGKIKENECENCHVKVCHKCFSVDHADKPCQQENIDNKLELLLVGGSNVNQCPSCKITIFKSYGCNSMFCWNCSVYFSWDSPEKTYNNSNNKDFVGKNYYEIYRDQLKAGKARRIDG